MGVKSKQLKSAWEPIRWEYHVTENRGSDNPWSLGELNDMGGMGWEVCVAIGGFWLFKRVVPPCRK